VGRAEDMGEQDATAEAAPPESSGPNRFVSFARYFKTYMGLAAVVMTCPQ